MTSDELFQTFQELMERDDIDQATINRMLLGLNADTRQRLNDHQQVTAERLSRIETMIEAQAKVAHTTAETVSTLAKYQKDHPSLLFLLRYNTKQTIMVIIIAFLALSILYVSSVRESLLALLGL